jgi:hypothetical protein
MTVLHPLSSMSVARLAAKLVNDGSWAHINRVEAREIITRMERAAVAGPAEDSPGARVLAANAVRLSTLASSAYEAHELLVDGRDLSWLWDPAQMDAIARMAFEY